MLTVETHRATALSLNIQATPEVADEHLLSVAVASASPGVGEQMQKPVLLLNEIEFGTAL